MSCPGIVDDRLLPDLYHRGNSDTSAVEKGQKREPGISMAVEDDGEGGDGDGGERQTKERDGNRNGQPSEDEDDSDGTGDSSRRRRKQAEETREDNPWGDGFRRRHELRQKSRPDSTQSRYTTPRDPHGSIPHASSGQAAHRGRGGFPGVHQILFPLISRIFPTPVSQLSDLLHRYEEDGLHTPHPMRDLGKILEKPFDDARDASEKRDAQHARWLPSGVRSVVVGRNSQFFEEELNNEDLELLGALEYRASRILTILLIAVSMLA